MAFFSYAYHVTGLNENELGFWCFWAPKTSVTFSVSNGPSKSIYHTQTHSSSPVNLCALDHLSLLDGLAQSEAASDKTGPRIPPWKLRGVLC